MKYMSSIKPTSLIKINDLQDLENDNDVSSCIVAVSKQIKDFQNLINNKSSCAYAHNILDNNINDVLNYWVGCTYIGCRKSESLTNAFSLFYKNLLELILTLKDHKYDCILTQALYQGPIYRVLGYGESKQSNSKPIDPEYDLQYVSWSNNPNIPTDYMINKLSGTITKLEANIKGDDFGIDLTVLGVSRHDEGEIIFQMKKDAITNVSYIKDE